MPTNQLRCALNRCTQQQGTGTWVRVAVAEDEKVLPVCEQHWQILRYVSAVARVPAIDG